MKCTELCRTTPHIAATLSSLTLIFFNKLMKCRVVQQVYGVVSLDSVYWVNMADFKSGFFGGQEKFNTLKNWFSCNFPQSIPLYMIPYLGKGGPLYGGIIILTSDGKRHDSSQSAHLFITSFISSTLSLCLAVSEMSCVLNWLLSNLRKNN